MEAMWWIERVIYLGFAVVAVWVLVNLLRNQRQHSALSKRMEQYGEWIKGYSDMSLADQKVAQSYAPRVFSGGFDYHGPWEDDGNAQG